MKIYLINLNNQCVAVSSHPLIKGKHGWKHADAAVHNDTYVNLYKFKYYSTEQQEFMQYLFNSLPENTLITWDL